MKKLVRAGLKPNNISEGFDENSVKYSELVIDVISFINSKTQHLSDQEVDDFKEQLDYVFAHPWRSNGQGSSRM